MEGATSGLGEVIGIIGGRCLEAVGTFPMLPYASVDLPTQPHVPTPFPAQCHSKQPQPFVPATGPLRATTGSIMAQSCMPDQSAGRLADAERPIRGSTSPSSA